MGTSWIEGEGEVFRIAIASVGGQCLGPADPAIVVIMQGYLEVSQVFQSAFALAEEWVSEKASEHMG